MIQELTSQLSAEFQGNLDSELKQDEGIRRYPYRDPRGFNTVGAGHNLDVSPLPRGWEYPLTDSQIGTLLISDVAEAERQLKARMTWTQLLPDDARKGVLIDLVFNLGIGALLQFRRMLGFCQVGQWQAAAGELRNSKYYTEVPLRAERLARQMVSNQWAQGASI